MTNIKNHLDHQNARFWSEPCGIQAFQQLKKHSEEANQVFEFDRWYFEFYPYLFKYLESLSLRDADVLEIGIGMGTVSRYLSTRAKNLTCLDIAPGAIANVKPSIDESLPVDYVCQSILDFSSNKQFDIVIAIGSLHHTGDLEASLKKVEDLTKRGGSVVIMVYYAFQLRRVLKHPIRTFNEFLSTFYRNRNQKLIFVELDETLRSRVDSNLKGEPAPYTVFSSRKLFLRKRSVVYSVRLENFNKVPLLNRLISRNLALKLFSRTIGCDIYAFGEKR